MSELSDVKDALLSLVNHIDQSLPEERVQAILERAKAEEKNSRRRIMALFGTTFLLAGLISGVGWWQSRDNGKALDKISVVSDFVENCLQHPERLNAAERRRLCGGNDGDGLKLIQGLIQFQKCSLLILPEDRTEENLNACAVKAMGG